MVENGWLIFRVGNKKYQGLMNIKLESIKSVKVDYMNNSLTINENEFIFIDTKPLSIVY